jgi:uncharacterized membrane protein (DUF485 family)
MSNAKLAAKTNLAKVYFGIFGWFVIASSVLLASLTTGATESFTVGVGFGIGLFLALFIHALIYVLRQSKGWNRKWNAQEGSALSWYGFLRDMSKLFVGSLILVGLALIAGYTFLIETEFVGLTPAFYGQMGGYAAYTFVVFPLLKVLGPRFKGFNLPDYRLMQGGFELELNMRMKGEEMKVSFQYAEIESVQLMNRYEAKSFMRHQLGMNTQVGFGSVKDLFQYAQGKIERPRYYESIQSGGMVLVLQGPELLYMVTVKGDGQDLLEAFNRSGA